jgi:2-oxoisovalerate dehydrogenase E1 component
MTTTPEPIPAATRAALLASYRHMLRARQIDRIETEYVRRGVAFFSVSGAGHEATAVLADFLGDDDWLHCHYRDKALMLARGISARMFFLSLFNKDGSHSRGRQMNAQMSAPELKVLSQVCPVGNGALQADGVAATVKDQAARPIVLCSLGDGMTQQGEVYEAIAQAVRDTLPVLFLIQDNGLALSTPTVGRTFYSTPDGDQHVFCSLPIVRIDGRDAVAARDALGEVVATMRDNRRPAIVVFQVDRLDDHSSSDDQRRYRPAHEIARIRATGDPLARLRAWLIAQNVAPAELEAFERESENELRELAEAALRAPEPSPTLTALRPLPPEFTDARREYRGGEAKGGGDELTMLEAIRAVLRERLRQDDRVTLCGEDIDDPKGDVFGITRGLSSEFPQRVANSPLAEATIVGMAIGQALAGKRPVAFLQFADFLPLAYNQIQAELATLHWRSDGAWPAPVIVMVPCGGYRPGLGPFHSACMDGVAAHIPGIDVFMPSTAGDAAGMLNAAFASERPTIFFYPKNCLNERSVTTTPDVARQFVPLRRARICRSGDDLTLVAWGNTVRLCLQAADALALAGIAAEVIDLRCLAPLDIDSVLASATRTGKLLVAHEDIQTAGIGAEVIARVAESTQTATRPIVCRRVARADTHVPCNFANQLDVLPSLQKIVDTAVAMLGGEVAWRRPDADPASLHMVKAIGLSPTDETVTLVEWQIKAGDRLQVGQIVATLEAEKTTFDFISPLAGEVVQLRCAPGQRVAIGEPLLALRCADGEAQRLPVTREDPGMPVISGIGRQTPEAATTSAARDEKSGAPTGDGPVVIAAIATALGSRRVGNDEIAALCPAWTADEVLKRIGVETRYWVGDDEDALTLALAACRQLLAETSLTVGDIDLIVCATGTPLYASPSLAALLQHELSAGGCETATYDISAACTGYLTGLQIAYDTLRSRPAQRVLLVTSETLSRKLDLGSRDTAPLFGDAASATLLVGAQCAATVPPIARLHRPLLAGRGEPAQALTSPTASDGFITMDGLKVYESAVRKMPEILLRACAEASVAVNELALVIPHQANQRIIDAIRMRMKLGRDTIYSNFRNYGNTSSSSIPLCLAETLAARAPGERLGLTAFGGGFTWGAAIVETLGGSTKRPPTRT